MSRVLVNTAADIPSLMLTTGPVTLSDPQRTNLNVYRGDTGIFRIEVSDADMNPVNITAGTFDGDIRTAVDSAQILASFAITPTVGDVSSIDCLLTAEESEKLDANCVYDIEMTLNGVVTTLLQGDIIITKDVSRA